MEAPVTRHMLFARADGDTGDGRTLTGLACPFNTITRIHDWWEDFDEQFAPGAFARSLGLKTPKLQFEHGRHPLFGSLPIGEFRSIEETKRGLEVEAQIFESELFAPLREAIASEAIDGMSIRFRPLKVEVTDADARDDDSEFELQTIIEADLLELGPVVFPAYPSTEVDLRSLGSVDLTNESDRHRLAQALLSGVALAGNGSGSPDGSGTGRGERPPATTGDQANGHSHGHAPRRNRRRQRLALLHREI